MLKNKTMTFVIASILILTMTVSIFASPNAVAQDDPPSIPVMCILALSTTP